MTKLHHAVAALAVIALSPAIAGPGQHVAGLAPWQRPAGAPVIEDLPQTMQWRAAALHGVNAPHPASLKFLDHQGAWYTPFDRPGMPGRYDLRGWHGNADSGARTR